MQLPCGERWFVHISASYWFRPDVAKSHTDTLAYITDTLAHPTRVTDRGLDNDVTDTSFTPPRAGREIVALLRGFLAGLGRAGRESGALVPELPACLGYRPWAREPGKKKKKKEDKTLNIQNVQSLLCLSGLWLLTTAPTAVG